MMRVQGERMIAASPEDIWGVIFDPDFMTQVVPGCKEMVKTGDDEYHFKMVLGIPAVQGRYKGVLKILEREPYSRIVLNVKGQGSLGRINGEGTIELLEENRSTRFSYSIGVDIRGPMASMSGAFMEQVADMLTMEGMKNFSEKVESLRNTSADTESPEKEMSSSGSSANRSMVWLGIKAMLRVLFRKFLNMFRLNRGAI